MERSSVLVVDDSLYDRSMLTSALHAFNVRKVVHAINGVDAISQLNSGLRPDFVFLDIQMPVMDGYEVLSAIEEMKLDRAFKVFIFSDNYFRSGSKLPCIKKGLKLDLIKSIRRVFEEQGCLSGDYA